MSEFPNILNRLDHKDYEHPFDRRALEALLATPGVEKVSKLIVKHTIERLYTIQYTGSNIKVDGNNFPDINNTLLKACKLLELNEVPDLYLQWDYTINGFTTGAEKPFVVLNTGTIDLCNEKELLFMLGHEIGHIKSQHMLYHMMAQGYNEIASLIAEFTFGIGRVITTPIQLALFYWYRMSEFSADRAGMLCCQDLDGAIGAMMKIAGTPVKYYNNIVHTSFINQATEFKKMDYDGLNKLFKTLTVMDQTHPWTVMRAAEMLSWVNEGAYNKIISKY